MKGQLWVEIVIRKKQIKEIPTEFDAIINEYKQFESVERLVLDVPKDWEGFKDGTILDLLKYFNTAVYLALAYMTSDRDEIVTDFEGQPVDMYEITLKDRRIVKYVKKRLRITNILDKETNTFEVVGYELDLKYIEPAINVLKIYSGSVNSGISLNQFVKVEEVVK